MGKSVVHLIPSRVSLWFLGVLAVDSSWPMHSMAGSLRKMGRMAWGLPYVR